MNENILFFGHNSGLDDNIHLFTIIRPIDENKKCQVRKGCLEKVSDFREASKQYYKDIAQKRFPPSYYLAEGETKRIGDLFEKIHTSPNSRILTGYNPVKHLEVLGFEDKDFDDCFINKEWNFENTVTVLVPENLLILFGTVVESKNYEEVKAELKKCNDWMKAVYAANQKNISNRQVTIVGTIIFTSISKEELYTIISYFPFLNILEGKCMESQKVIFLCEEQVRSESDLQIWWFNLCKVICIRPPNQLQEESQEAVRNVTGEMMASMSIISSYLPKVTDDVGEKIATLLLNPHQVDVIMDKTQWKVITGPYGSGKSICLKEIARRLHGINDGSKIIYCCFDPYSLMEAEIDEFFKTLSKDGRLQSLSLVEISSKIGYSVEQFYNCCGPPARNIADLFEYLENTNGKCHILVDEFHADNINEKYCNQLKRCLVQNFQDSTVVFAMTSVTTTKQVLDMDKLETYEQCSLEEAGMHILPPLTKSVRIPANIFDLTEVAIAEIKDVESTIPLSNDLNDTSMGARKKTKIRQSSRTSSFKKILKPILKLHGKNHLEVSDPSINVESKVDQFRYSNLFTSEFNNSEKSAVYKLSDPQMIAKLYPDSLPNNIHDSTRLLKSKSNFVYGECSSICSPINSRLIYLPNDFSVENSKFFRIFAKLLEELTLKSYQKISFICNNINEITLVKYALELCQYPSITYAPYLLGRLPNSEEKREVVKRLNNEVGSHLITDYRSFRGCETSNCFSFVDLNEKFASHVLIEVITRATSKLDLVVFPSSPSSSTSSLSPSEKESPSCWSKILASWNEDDLINKIQVQVKCHKVPDKFTIVWADKSHTIKMTKTDLKVLTTIQELVQKERQDNFDKEKPFE